jgi:alkanesulfonate monooxygenase
VTLFAAVAQHTSRIGLVATTTTSYEEPFTIARKFASLDHLSGGRSGWNLVTTQYVEDAKNFGRDEHMGRVERYERARESLDVVRTLWDSWATDAFLEDKSTGRYLDPARVRLTNHRGTHFKVKGPLNVARAPQGQPVVFMAGQSEAGKELAAYGGEGLFGTASGKAEAQREYADIKGRMAKYGRPTEALKILPALSVFVGRTAAEADALYEELQALIPPALAVSYLSKVVGFDVTGAPLDGPMPRSPGENLGGTAIGRSVLEMAQREGLSVRATYQRVLPSMGGNMVKGDPGQVADFMEDWYKSQACDGFMLSMPVQPRSLRDFVELVVPELQRRGLRPLDYPGATLRDNMGLARPADPFERAS